MSSVCAGCNRKIKDLYFMKCSKCTETFDVACINMTREYFGGLKDEKKNEWLCPTCVCSQPKGDNSSTPVRSLDAVKCVKQSNTRDVAGDCNVNVTRGGRNVNKPKSTTLSSSNPQTDITNQLSDLKNISTQNWILLKRKFWMNSLENWIFLKNRLNILSGNKILLIIG